MDIEARTRVTSAGANGRPEHTLIGEAKARQLFELSLDLHAQCERGDANARWLSGREAVLAGVMAELRDGDALVTESEVRISDGHRLSVRWPAETGMADLIVELLGAATIDRLRRNGRVTVIFLPAGQAVSAEARALTCAAGLPVLFVGDGQAGNGKNGEEMPVIPADADDVVALFRVAHESIVRARSGGGPTQIVCRRWGRSGKSGAAGEDAVVRLEQWLTARGLPAEAWRGQWVARWKAANATAEAGMRPLGKGSARSESAPFALDPQPFAQPDIQTN